MQVWAISIDNKWATMGLPPGIYIYNSEVLIDCEGIDSAYP